MFVALFKVKRVLVIFLLILAFVLQQLKIVRDRATKPRSAKTVTWHSKEVHVSYE